MQCLKIVSIILMSFFISIAYAAGNSFPFPVNHYDQNLEHWINPRHLPAKPLMSREAQNAQFKNFYQQYLLPWDRSYITKILKSDMQAAQSFILEDYDNSKIKIESNKGRPQCNDQPYTETWLAELKTSMNLVQFSSMNYDPRNSGIALTNLNGRALPTEQRYFHDCNFPGEGDSFDYLQVSALWAGTPVYILGETLNHEWYLIASPDFIAWVKSDGIARVDNNFIVAFKQAAKKLVAINAPINNTKLTIADESTHTLRFTAYIGAVFPLLQEDEEGFHVFIPVRNAMHQDYAQIERAFLKKSDAVLMPLSPTVSHFIEVINNMKGMDYGWGGLNINNPAEFTYDCSAELKSLYTPFGIWLPRHSSEQVNPVRILGSVFDFSKDDTVTRINHLTEKDVQGSDHPFTTIVYIGGHVFMYLGSYINPDLKNNEPVPLTYQNVWGLRPDLASGPDGRYVLGKAVLLPLLAHYPEQYPYPVPRNLISQASRSYFQVAHLDQFPSAWSRIYWYLFAYPQNKMSVRELINLMLP